MAPWRDAIPRLERQMAAAEVSLDSLDRVCEAMRLVIQIEGSEINGAFQSVVAASGSEFVRKMRPFQTAVAEHISFICHEVPKLEPELAEECQRLAGRHHVETR